MCIRDSPNTTDILYSVSMEHPTSPFLNSSLLTKSYDLPISTASCSCVIPVSYTHLDVYKRQP